MIWRQFIRVEHEDLSPTESRLVISIRWRGRWRYVYAGPFKVR